MSNKRFIASVVKTAKTETPALPWQRGATHMTNLSSRHATSVKRKTA